VDEVGTSEEQGVTTAMRVIAAVGAIALIVARVMGPSVQGYSLATLLNLIAVLALGGAAVLGRDQLLVAWSQKGQSGRPFAAAFVVLILFAAAQLWITFKDEMGAATRWELLEEALDTQGDNADQPLYAAWRDAPNDEMRTRILVRLGEIGGTRAQWFLQEKIRDNELSDDVRKTGATSLAKIATPIVRKALLERVRVGDPLGRAQARRVLTAMVGADLGEKWEAWHDRFLADDLADGSPEALERFLDLLPTAPERNSYMRHREGFYRAAKPEWRERIEGELDRVSTTWQDDLRVNAARTLARLGDRRSIRRLIATFGLQKLPAGRQVFVESIGALGGNDVFGPHGKVVFEFLVSRIEKDPAADVRHACAVELQRMTGATVAVDAAGWRAWRAAQALTADIAAGKLSRIIPEARRAAKTNDLVAFRPVLDALVRVGNATAMREVRGFVMEREYDARIRQMAIDALAGSGQGLDRDQLLSLLDGEDDARIAQAAIRGLASHDETRVIRALGERYEIEEAREVRGAIVRVLAKMTEDATLTALVPAVRDESPEIAALAQDTLKSRTGQDLGDDAEAWAAWIAKYVQR